MLFTDFLSDTGDDRKDHLIEVDGKEIDAEKFWEILSMYEEYEISFEIKEQQPGLIMMPWPVSF